MVKKNKILKQKKQLEHLNKNSIFKTFLEHIYSLNNSKFFAGFIMLIMNIK